MKIIKFARYILKRLLRRENRELYYEVCRTTFRFFNKKEKKDFINYLHKFGDDRNIEFISYLAAELGEL